MTSNSARGIKESSLLPLNNSNSSGNGNKTKYRQTDSLKPSLSAAGLKKELLDVQKEIESGLRSPAGSFKEQIREKIQTYSHMDELESRLENHEKTAEGIKERVRNL